MPTTVTPVKNIRQITGTLIACGRAPETPAAVISQGTTPRQRTVTGTLATIAALVEQPRLPTPAVTVIGEVVNLREKVAWFERRHGKSLVFPGPTLAAAGCILTLPP